MARHIKARQVGCSAWIKLKDKYFGSTLYQNLSIHGRLGDQCPSHGGHHTWAHTLIRPVDSIYPTPHTPSPDNLTSQAPRGFIKGVMEWQAFSQEHPPEGTGCYRASPSSNSKVSDQSHITHRKHRRYPSESSSSNMSPHRYRSKHNRGSSTSSVICQLGLRQ